MSSGYSSSYPSGEKKFLDRVPYFLKLTKNYFQSPNANMATFTSFRQQQGHKGKISVTSLTNYPLVLYSFDKIMKRAKIFGNICAILDHLKMLIKS